MLLGTFEPGERPSALPALAAPPRAFAFARCAGCGERGPMLATFGSPHSFESEFTHHEAVAAYVAGVMARTGRRVVLLCSWCLSDADQSGPAPPRQLTMEES